MPKFLEVKGKTKDSLRAIRNIGNFAFPSVPVGDYVFYILDGQQRATSIIASLTGQTIDGVNYAEIYVDLTANADEEVVVTDVSRLNADQYISLTELYELDLASIVAKYKDNNTIQKINDYSTVLKTYEFSKIELMDAPLDVATEVFTRINTSGKSLSIFEIMCAKMYSETPAFDLYEERETQRTNWQSASYETIPDATVLQAVAACLTKDCRGKNILNLDKNSFIAAWDDVEAAFEQTIDYFKNTYNVPVSKLVPYDALYVPFVYYFYNKKQRPAGAEQKYLADYFWRATFDMRFTEGAVSKINHDIVNVIDVILAGKKPVYDHGLVINRDSLIRNGGFSVGSAYIKGILCILCGEKPVSFMDGHAVTIDNSWLSQGNSKNYHHFFPKDYMKKKQPLIEENLVNHIANITIVDGWLNKTQIKAKAPSDYMDEYRKKNSKLDKHMKTHLISDLNAFGVFNDDYNLFFENRLQEIHAHMVGLLDKTAEDNFTYK